MQPDTVGRDLPGHHPVGAGAGVEARHGVEGLGDQHTGFPGGDVGSPRLVGVLETGLGVPADQPALLVVGVDDVGVPEP